jgi:hypothetical protein
LQSFFSHRSDFRWFSIFGENTILPQSTSSLSPNKKLFSQNCRWLMIDQASSFGPINIAQEDEHSFDSQEHLPFIAAQRLPAVPTIRHGFQRAETFVHFRVGFGFGVAAFRDRGLSGPASNIFETKPMAVESVIAPGVRIRCFQ